MPLVNNYNNNRAKLIMASRCYSTVAIAQLLGTVKPFMFTSAPVEWALTTPWEPSHEPIENLDKAINLLMSAKTGHRLKD